VAIEPKLSSFDAAYRGPNGAASALAGQIRAPAGRGAAHRANPVRREESGRDQGGGVFGGAAAKGDA